MKIKYKYLIGVLSFLLAVALLFFVLMDQSPSSVETVKIKNQSFEVHVARSREERMKGLSGQESMCDNCGMLFEFPESGKYSFWMKDMLFSLDILWLNDKKIVHIEKNVDFADPRVFFIPS